MRTKNEKILLAVLIAILFISANFYGYRWLSQKQTTLDLTYAQLRADKADDQIDLLKKDVWQQRKTWIKDHEPVLTEEGDTRAQVLEHGSKGAHDNNLEVLEQSLNDVQQGPSGTRISVTLKIKGSMEGLCHWLADLQKPDSFYAVSKLSLKADQDQKSMICTVQLTRYFKGGS